MAHSRYWPIALTIALALTAGCAADTGDTESLEGVWLLEAFSENGGYEIVQPESNTAKQPWVEIGVMISGNLGCNAFQSGTTNAYTYENGILKPGETLKNASACLGNGTNDVMEVENLITDVLWQYPEGIAVEITNTKMIWRAGNIELIFRSTASPPAQPPPPPPSVVGNLDCSPGFVWEEYIAGDSRTTEEVLLDTVSEVVRTEEDQSFVPSGPPGWFWLGYDENDTAIAFIARGDVEPPQYQLFTCVEN